MKKKDFYFDFGSPYSYLAHTQIKKFEKETGEKVNYMPTLRIPRTLMTNFLVRIK